ncbi:MAG: domain S-box [Desulfomicrobiaceae bacterium]|jgi:CheY-like chemotaxis protein/HPt (histidine-containing phosphotransfer) domain-containing protein|nr:domain S-box [Desulfomicrobiaceae bacterium]
MTQESQQRLHEELARACAERDAVQNRLVRIREKVERHLQTNMAALVAMLDLLQDSGLGAAQVEYVLTARRSAEAIRSVLSALLDETDLSPRSRLGAAQTFDLRLVVDDIMQLCHLQGARLSETGCAVAIDEAVPGLVRGYPGLLRRMIGSIAQRIVGGLRRGQMRCVVRLMHAQGEEVMVRVTLEVRGEVRGLDDMSPFADASTAHKAQEAHIVAAVVEHPQGFDVSWDIPLGLPQSGSPDLPAPVSIAGRRILVVDQEESWRQVLREYAYLWGCTLEEVASGKEAVQSLHRAREAGQSFHVVVVDDPEDMPAEDLARSIRRDSAWEGMRLVRLASASRPGDAQRMHDAGFDGYFVKPMDRDSLREALELVLGSAAVHQSPMLITRHTVAEARKWRRGALVVARGAAARQLELLLTQAEFSFQTVDSWNAAVLRLAQERPGIVFWVEEEGGPEVDASLRALRQSGRDVPVVLVRSHPGAVPPECAAALTLPIDVVEFARVLDAVVPVVGGERGERTRESVLDVEALLQQLDQDRTTLRDIVQDFVHEAAARIDELALAVSREDFAAATEKAWSLRGMAGNVRASTMALRAEMVELAARRGDGRKCLALLQDLCSELERVRAVVEALGGETK